MGTASKKKRSQRLSLTLTLQKREEKPRTRSGSSQALPPVFMRCILVGPDGAERPGWEMRIGKQPFGRAESKKVLLEYYARLLAPLPSGHWKERSWYPPKAFPIRLHKEAPEEEPSEPWE